jgi:Flp pilus assembly protein TadD
VYLREGKWSEAIPQFRKLSRSPPTPIPYSNLGTAYFFLKNYDQATKMYEKAVEMTPNDEELQGNLGDAYRWSGHSDQAAAAYGKAISLAFQELQVNPRSPPSWAISDCFMPRRATPRTRCNTPTKRAPSSPDDVQLMYSEAQVKTLIGKPEEALKSLRLALEKGYPAQEAWNDPELQKLQALPQFSQLVNQFTKKNH